MACRLIVRRLATGIGALFALAGTARAQRPDAHWRTIATPHFRVHFAPESEEIARRAAASAEWAYAALSRELVPPRGTIELVVSDDVDFSNGSTTTFPTNRIVVYAQPPVDVSSLRNYSDWMTLVVTHELTHVFHLDRTRGFWSALQHVFGRNPYTFPAAYEPRWMTEGIAVYYESRITGSGRIVGTEHRALARAAALAGQLPALGALSSSRTSFPGGGSVYIYGSLVFDELAREEGVNAVPRFIERSSAALPFFYNRLARKQFGESFADLLRAVRDTSLRVGQGSFGVEPLAGWRALTTGFERIRSPRWRDSMLVFAGDRGRETAGAYEVAPDGRLRRLGRRVGDEPNVPLADGSLLTAQLEFVGPHEVRSDLYVQRGRRLHRLTHGGRLTSPDARRDGEIVAVRGTPGTTTLARVSADGRRSWPMMPAALDTQWAQPRWSPAGDAIAAVRLIHGGRSQIVVLDTLGAVQLLVADEAGSVSASPSWSSDGRTLWFTSDRSGTREVYAASVGERGAALPPAVRASRTVTALSDPEPGPSAGRGPLAAVLLGADGMTLGRGDAITDSSAPAPARAPDSLATLAPRRDDALAGPYRAARQLVPRYWLPTFRTTDGGLILGAVTSANDVVGRHSLVASVEMSTRRHEQGGELSYAWAGLGRPVLQLAAAQAWDGAGTIVRPNGNVAGVLRRRTRVLEGGLSSTRPRTQTFLAASVAGGLELRDYATDPRPLLAGLSGNYFETTHRRPFVFAGLVGSNVQSPGRSISLEDGITARASGERLWDADERSGGHSRAIGSLAGYRSLDLPGFAHHVLALRMAGGWTDSEDGADLSVGGLAADLFGPSGLSVGGTREFPVRGYVSGALSGTRALAASLEYRAPLIRPSRGIGVLYFDRTSLALFGDAATAWCRGPARIAGNCVSSDTMGTPIASVGAEVVLDLAVFYDAPLSLAIGVAEPVGRLRGTSAAAAGAYISAGHSF